MSSRSPSSNRRSSSRRSSSRSGKSKGKKNSLAKSAAKDGVNFWAMFAGFIIGLTLLFLIISLFTKDQINPDLIAANDENRAEVATRAEKQDFDTFVKQANVDQLADTLKSLHEIRQFREDSDFRTNYQRKQKIIDAMSDEALSKEHHKLSTLVNIQSTASAFWTDQNSPLALGDLGMRLREITELHEEASDPEIAFEARLELALLNSVGPIEETASHARELYQLLVDYPESKRVHGVIKTSLNRTISSPEKSPSTLKILDHLLNQGKVTGNQDTNDLYLLLTDLWSLCDHEFFSAKENLKYTAKAGRDQMRDVCAELSQVPTAGREIVGHIREAANSMENNGHYAHAIEIYKALQACSARLPSRDMITSMQLHSSQGLRRCQAVGEPFNLEVDTFDGQPLKLLSLESMPVLIVFWSKTDGTEVLLPAIEKSSERWQRNSVKILAVQVEKNNLKFDKAATSNLKKQFPKWDFFYDDGTGTGPIFSQVPSEYNGRIVLLDRGHRLYDVSVSMEELVTTVKKVLAIRHSEN